MSSFLNKIFISNKKMISDYFMIVEEKILYIIDSECLLVKRSHHLKNYWEKVQNSVLLLTYLFSFPTYYHYLCNYFKWSKGNFFLLNFLIILSKKNLFKLNYFNEKLLSIIGNDLLYQSMKELVINII